MKRNHHLSFVMMLMVLMATLVSCGSSDSGSSTPLAPTGKVLTESDFLANPALKATPSDTVAVFFLEPPTDTEQTNDPQKGVDIIPYQYETGGMATFCWNDDNPDDVNAMVLKDSNGNELVRIVDNDECKTINLSAGNYFMYLYHDERTRKTLTLFIRPIHGTSSAAGSVRASKTDYNTLISTNSCPGCDLSGAKLAGANLEKADLAGAGMIKANLEKANLAGANLEYALLDGGKMKGANLSEAKLSNVSAEYADLTGADLAKATLKEAQLNDANLTSAKLERADLTDAMLWKANLTLANFQYATLINAYLYEAQMAGANWTGANLSKATWYDAATCADNSIGVCK